ncbi:hypothetical protein D3C83_102530 [compost metagenome]
MKRAVVPAASLISVSSRKSPALSMVTYGFFALRRSAWCLTMPKPAEQSENAGTKIGTPFS